MTDEFELGSPIPQSEPLSITPPKKKQKNNRKCLRGNKMIIIQNVIECEESCK